MFDEFESLYAERETTLDEKTKRIMFMFPVGSEQSKESFIDLNQNTAYSKLIYVFFRFKITTDHFSHSPYTYLHSLSVRKPRCKRLLFSCFFSTTYWDQKKEIKMLYSLNFIYLNRCDKIIWFDLCIFFSSNKLSKY